MSVPFQFLGEFVASDQSGKKAGNLDLLLKEGFLVPPGFLITAASARQERLQDQDLKEALNRIGGFPVAVRSSAGLEDLKMASFAGQYQTFLEISDLPALRNAIEKCKQSEYSAHAQNYLRSVGAADVPVNLNVLVQKMVDAKISGVAFSIHPMSGKETEALIEWCEGLGEKLVSGLVTPSRAIVSLEKKTAIVQNMDSERGIATASLDAFQIKNLTDQILQIQAYFGTPQDIEWSIDSNQKIWILQSRPITQIAWRSDIDEFSNANFKDGGVSARVCTPLMYSIYQYVYQNSMTTYLRKIKLIDKHKAPDTFIDSFYGRVYWNASAIKRALTKVPGFDEASFDSDIGIQKSYGKNGPIRVPMSLKTLLPAIPIAIALAKDFKETLSLANRYGERFLPEEAAHLKIADTFATLPDSVFFEKLIEVLDVHHQVEIDYFLSFYANSNFQSEFKKQIASLQKIIGKPISMVDLLGGLEGVSHLESQTGLLRLYHVAKKFGFQGKEWSEALKNFLQDYYFHGDAELDLTARRWGEDPKRIEIIVNGMLNSGSVPRDPVETSLMQKQNSEKQVKKITDELQGKLLPRIRYQNKFLKNLNLARTYLRSREKMREYSTRSYYRLRIYLLEADKRFEKLGILKADAIFMLHASEIKYLANRRRPTEDLLAKIEYRRLMYRGYRDFSPPDELGKGVKLREQSAQEKIGDRVLLRGVGCSAGRAEGIVRVISTLAEAINLGKEDILVTRFTDPGWTPVLGMVKGVVTEVGGLLSHAAVIGREFGIPAVLNLPGATQILKTGQKIIIDGTEGTIEIIS